jgi:hypothetical protein
VSALLVPHEAIFLLCGRDILFVVFRRGAGVPAVASSRSLDLSR